HVVTRRRHYPRPRHRREDADPPGRVQEEGHLLGRGVADIPRRRLRLWSLPIERDQEGGDRRARALQTAEEGGQRGPHGGGRETRALLLPRREDPRGARVSPATRAPAPQRTLTLRELNRAMPARQMLLAREKLTVVSAIERLVALQAQWSRSEEHTSELQSRFDLVCR